MLFKDNVEAPHHKLQLPTGKQVTRSFLTVLIQLQHLLNGLFSLTVPLQCAHSYYNDVVTFL